jgi:hypothetical protein
VSINGCPIRSTPLAGRFDSITECDPSDTCYGSVTFVDRPGVVLLTVTLSVVAALLALATWHLTGLTRVLGNPAGTPGDLVRGSFPGSFPAYTLETGSTLRELFGVYRVLRTIAP